MLNRILVSSVHSLFRFRYANLWIVKMRLIFALSTKISDITNICNAEPDGITISFLMRSSRSKERKSKEWFKNVYDFERFFNFFFSEGGEIQQRNIPQFKFSLSSSVLVWFPNSLFTSWRKKRSSPEKSIEQYFVFIYLDNAEKFQFHFDIFYSHSPCVLRIKGNPLIFRS